MTKLVIETRYFFSNSVTRYLSTLCRQTCNGKWEIGPCDKIKYFQITFFDPNDHIVFKLTHDIDALIKYIESSN